MLLVLSSDHRIDNENNFRDVIENSLSEANNGRLITFGIKPYSPETGYGYINSYEELDEEKFSSIIKNFVEKPNIELAKSLLKINIILGTVEFFFLKQQLFLKN